jgi:hypothetical protein
VFNGSAQGASLTPSATVDGAGLYFGYAISAQGSVLGDETPDLAVTAPLESGQAGKVYFFDGDTIAAGGTIVHTDADATFTAIAGGIAGLTINSGHDFVGDAGGDMVIGAYNLNSARGGVFILAGNVNGGLSGDYTATSPNVTTLETEIAGSQMGFRVTVGQVIGTAKKDLIINHGTSTSTWRIYQGGETIGATPTVTLPNPGANDRFKYANQHSACDINGDGFDDIILGANTKAYVYFGSELGAGFNTSADREYDLGSGWGLGICADANGDNFIDLAVVRTVSGGSWRLRY